MKTSPSRSYVLKEPDELLAAWDARRRKDAGMIDWDLDETVGKLLAFFGGEKQEPGKAARGDLEREAGL